jgi:hypothetical protein
VNSDDLRRFQAHKAAGWEGAAVSWVKSRQFPAPAGTPTPNADTVSFGAGESSFEVVPAIYFSEGFDLREPATFEQFLISTAPAAQQQKASRVLSCVLLSITLILCVACLAGTYVQLTLYLDKIEDEIAMLVKSRADDFVSALTTLQVVLRIVCTRAAMYLVGLPRRI